MNVIRFTLIFDGRLSDKHQIDLYDVSQSIVGFQRTLALTTHLLVNDKIITQAPALKGAQIIGGLPEAGSWKFVAYVAIGLHAMAIAPRDTILGHIMHSAYDYVVSESLGFHVDYEQSLGQQLKSLDQHHPAHGLTQPRFDSLIEKCDYAIKQIHRPIVHSETATDARIMSRVGGLDRELSHSFSRQTFDYIDETITSDNFEDFVGCISSYNINTYSGRIFIPSIGRPIPFELSEDVRDGVSVGIITSSLGSNARERFNERALILIRAFQKVSRTNRLKSLLVVSVSRKNVD